MLNSLQKSWSPVRGPYNRLMREQSNGVLSLHRPRSVDMSPHGNNRTTRLTPRNGYVIETMLGEGDGLGDLKHLMDVEKTLPSCCALWAQAKSTFTTSAHW